MTDTRDERDQELRGWFTGRIPDGWFTGPPAISGDREELLVIGDLAAIDMGADATLAETTAAMTSRVEVFREETRQHRMHIAEEAEQRFGRKVSWGVRINNETYVFTTLATPVMTRLRQRERAVLDTLVDSGVARSRSEALAWCVRMVADNQGEWIDALRTALSQVETVRAGGPRPGGGSGTAMGSGRGSSRPN
jgi:hypothetical protein